MNWLKKKHKEICRMAKTELYDDFCCFNCTKEQKKAWKNYAREMEKKTLSEFIRNALDGYLEARRG
jgi:hypothetical protein